MEWPTRYQVKRWIKDFFYFPRSDRKVLLVMCMAFTGMAFYLLWQLFRPVPQIYPLTIEQRAQLDTFLAHIDQAKQIRQDSFQSLRSVIRFQEDRQEVDLFLFDPNTADSLQLARLGFRTWQIKNLLKYRSKGGRFRKPEDLARLYGLSPEFYERLKPYIRIDIKELALSESRKKINVNSFANKASMADTFRVVRDSSARPSKFSEGVIVDLNQADTGLLKRIPGIGTSYARMIINYRERLGGYVRVEQLLELEQLPDRITRWFCVSGSPQPLLINKLSVAQLKRHPYLNFYQARVVVEHRRKYGPLRSLDELSLYAEFSPADLDRLRPYVQF